MRDSHKRLDVRSALPLTVFLIGLCISAAAALWLLRENQAQSHSDFEVHVQRLVNDVVRRFRSPVYGLNGGRGVFAAVKQVRRAAFRSYVQSRDLPNEFPGVRGFGYVQNVARDKLATFIAGERADDAPQFGIRSLGLDTHAELYVIKFIEPTLTNSGILGLDLGSEALRRQSIERAVESGEATMTAPIKMIQDERRRPGFLLFVPVFRHGGATKTPEQRRAAFEGLLYAPIVAAELLDAAVDITGGMVDFDLSDAAGASASSRFIFNSRPALRAGHFSATRTLHVLGRDLTFSAHSTAQFDQKQESGAPLLLFLAGSLISVWLAILMWQQIALRRRAERVATGMGADLERLAQVVSHTSNSVAITDAELHIVWVNEGFTRISGYTMDEARGKTHDELLGDGSGSPAVLKQLASDGCDSDGCRVEIAYCAKNRQEYWLDVEFKPMLNLRGELNGFMEIGSDVTERRLEQARLEAALRENDALLRTIDLHAIVSVTDRAGNITAANDAFCRISGYARDELIGQNHRILNSGTQPATFWNAIWSTIAAGAPWRGEVCNRAKDGSLYWVDTIIAPFMDTDGKIEKYISIRTDVTASKNTTRELASERMQLDNILQGTNVGTWEWHIQTGELRINERWAQMIGYSLAEFGTATIDLWNRFMHPDDIIRSTQLLRAHFKGTLAHYEFEARLRHKQGHWIWVLLRGRLFARSEDGRAYQMAGTQMEITQRRAMESELRRNNEVMNAVLENLPCGLSVFDADLRLVASNRKFRDLLDFPDRLFEPAEIHFEDFIRYNGARGEYGSIDVDAKVRDIVERARSPAQAHQFDRMRPGGMPLEIRGAPMPAGGFVTTYSDISDRLKAEAEVQRSAALLRGAIDAIDEAFVLFDPHDCMVFCNEKYRSVLPGDCDILVPGMSFENIMRVVASVELRDAEPAVIESWIAERIATHRAGTGSRMLHLADGRVLRIVERKMPDQHTVGFYVDITEMVRVTEAAQEASRVKSRFLANMSHEIRTPMNAIIGMSMLVLETQINADQRELLGIVKTSGEALLALINDILDFSKIEAGQMTLEMAEFDLHECVRGAARMLADRARAKDIAFDCAVGPSVPRFVTGDGHRLRQVLINLLSNAVKFTDTGWVKLTLSAAPATDADEVALLEFSVRDTGPGIPQDRLEQIFKPFSQADGSITRKFGGTGLGLSISGDLIGQMGGTISVDSVMGEGSTFHFSIRMPVAQPTRTDAWAMGTGVLVLDPAAVPDRDLLKCHVLLVDDIAVNRLLALRLLESMGHRVTVASNGLEAVQQVERNDFDLVLMDLQMPVMDGYEATLRIRQREAAGSRHTPIVAMTAHAMQDEKQRCLDAGMVGHVSKPISKQALWIAVQQHALPRTTRDLPKGLPSLPTPKPTPTHAAELTNAQAVTSEPAMPPVSALAVKPGPLRDEAAALEMLGGDRELLAELVQMFLQDLVPQGAELSRVGAAGDLPKLGRLAHAQKGAAGAVGANAARLAASALETACNAGDTSSAAHWLDALLHALQALRSEADAIFRSEL
jgi:PAS domain S-box-containing protein